MVTTNRDDGAGADLPHAGDQRDEHDLGDLDVNAFERHIRHQDRRRRMITAAILALALAGATAFAVGAVLTRPRSRYADGIESSASPSYLPPTYSRPAVVDASTEPPRPVPTAPHPSRLPMCTEPTTPPAFRAMCQLDAPAPSAVFDCEHPTVHMAWPRAVRWGCPPIAPGQPRPVSIELAFDRQGEMPAHGEVVTDGDPRLAPTGVIRKVEASLRMLDRTAASDQVKLLRAAARGWGCVEVIRPPYRARHYDRGDEVFAQIHREHEERRRLAMEHELDCGPQWKIRTLYHDTLTLLVIEAASPLGFELTAYDAAPLPPPQDSGEPPRSGMTEADSRAPDESQGQ